MASNVDVIAMWRVREEQDTKQNRGIAGFPVKSYLTHMTNTDCTEWTIKHR